MLQNLSNGQMFGDKEEFMRPCNTFLEQHRQEMDQYFDRLIRIEELTSQLAVGDVLWFRLFLELIPIHLG